MKLGKSTYTKVILNCVRVVFMRVEILNGKYYIVEQSGIVKEGDNKQVSSKISIKEEIGWQGLFKAGIEYIEKLTMSVDISNDISDNGGYYAKIGSSSYEAKIASIGKDSVIMCAGNNSTVCAKKGSWITLSEWKYDKDKGRLVPKCVKTEYVDGDRIKEDVWYELVDGEFKEVENEENSH